MNEPAKAKEPLLGARADSWINKDFGRVSIGFGQIDSVAVTPHLYLNHLLNLSELRKFNQDEVFFENELIRELRDKVTDFATVGKVTAQHLPLPRPDLIKEGYTFSTGAQKYQASVITPGFHSSPKFLHDNIKSLPISDFQNVIVATRINKEDKSIQVEKIPNDRSAQSIIHRIKPPTATAVFEEHFDKTVHGAPWSVAVYTDAAKPDSHWVELIVNTAEQFGSRREHTTPYVIEIEANHETIKKFTDQLHKAVEMCKSPTEQHKLLYYLTSTLYFQSDPELPYLTPDVKPGNLNESLPYDLFNVPLSVDNLDEIKPILDEALKKPDGLFAIEDLYNSGNKQSKNVRTLAPVVEELQNTFGSDYDNLASTVKDGFKDISGEIQQTVESEITRRGETTSHFDELWKMAEPKMVRIIGNALGFKSFDPESADYKKLMELMKMEKIVSNYRTSNLHTADFPTESTIEMLQESLVTDTMVARMRQVIKSIVTSPISLIIKIPGKQSFLNEWKQISEDMQKEFNITADTLERSFCQRVSRNENTVSKTFEAELNQARLTKNFTPFTEEEE